MAATGVNLLALCAAVTVAEQLFFFGIASTLRIDTLTDAAGTSNFALLAVLCVALTPGASARQQLVAALTVLWAVRLGFFLLRRVVQRGKDDRFDKMRDQPSAFVVFWVVQAVWVLVVSLPLLLLFALGDAAPKPLDVRGADALGLALWLLGFVVEVAADGAKHAFLRAAPAAKGRFIEHGLWAYSRHPNYFGEIVLWLGSYVLCLPALRAHGAWAAAAGALSPLFTWWLLVFLSGVPLAEARQRRLHGDDPRFKEYKLRTSPLVPFPPSVYRRLPDAIKRLVFLDVRAGRSAAAAARNKAE
jgi:steroid 5-alpha reductase family enzyme